MHLANVASIPNISWYLSICSAKCTWPPVGPRFSPASSSHDLIQYTLCVKINNSGSNDIAKPPITKCIFLKTQKALTQFLYSRLQYPQ